MYISKKNKWINRYRQNKQRGIGNWNKDVQLKTKWFGHIKWMDNDSIPVVATEIDTD